MVPACVLLLCLAASPAAGVVVHRDGAVDVDVKDADLRVLVTRLGEVGRLNVVLSKHVRGRVTLRVVRQPWKDTLRAVLHAHGLAMQLEGNVLYVDRADAVARERDDAFMQSWCTRARPLPADTFCGRP